VLLQVLLRVHLFQLMLLERIQSLFQLYVGHYEL
jgi:hypothetical protein